MKHIKGHPNRRFTGLDYVFRDLWENRSTKILSESPGEYNHDRSHFRPVKVLLHQKVEVKDFINADLPVKRAYELKNVLKTLIRAIPRQKQGSFAFFIIMY